MKILVLTSTATRDKKVYVIIDKIVAYYEEHCTTVVRMIDGSYYYVEESAAFITRQLVSANVDSYTVYNSEENNEN